MQGMPNPDPARLFPPRARGSRGLDWAPRNRRNRRAIEHALRALELSAFASRATLRGLTFTVSIDDPSDLRPAPEIIP